MYRASNLLFLLGFQLVCTSFDKESDISCSGKKFYNVSLAGYFTDYQNEIDDSQFHDKLGKKLRSLQDYLDNQCDFITLAMDEKLGMPYGTKVCIPEFNQHFGHHLHFEVRDNGTDLTGMGYFRADVYVRSEIDSYDTIVNRKVTLVFEA